MDISPVKLTFNTMRAAYVTVLQGQDGKALRVGSNSALFLKGDNLYHVVVGPTGKIEVDDAGCSSPLVWEEYLGCWESDEDSEATVAAVNSPQFIEVGPEVKGQIAMLTYPIAMANYRALLELNPGKALLLDKGNNGSAAALIDGEVCCLLVGSDNVADLSFIGDLMPEAWGIGGWHSEVEETQNAIDHPVFVDIRH